MRDHLKRAIFVALTVLADISLDTGVKALLVATSCAGLSTPYCLP